MPRGHPSWSSPLHLATAMSTRKLFWTSCHPRYHQMALVGKRVVQKPQHPAEPWQYPSQGIPVKAQQSQAPLNGTPECSQPTPQAVQMAESRACQTVAAAGPPWAHLAQAPAWHQELL